MSTEVCRWFYYEEPKDGNAFYKTGCGQTIFFLNFLDGSQYCSFCGKPLVVEDLEDEEDE